MSTPPIAVIAARGGSRRIPRKNLVDFFGHPMLAYAIAAARNSSLFGTVVVSTDDEEIGAVAREYGAEVVRRPDPLADDRAGVAEVVLHALDELQASSGDVVCHLMPNCPLRRSDDIVALWEAFRRPARSFQVSVVRYRGVYPHWAMERGEDGAGRWHFGASVLAPSQELPPLVCPTGAVWWADVDALRGSRSFYGKGFHVEEIDSNRGFDIDTPDDLELADLLVRGLRERGDATVLEPMVTA